MNAKRAAAGLGFLLLAGCRGARKPPVALPAQIRTGRVAPRSFVPPKDGRLTSRQVEEYVRWLRTTGRRGPGVFISDPADLEKIESAGQSSLGTPELSWVRGRVLAALLDIQSREADRRSLETYRRTLAGLRHALSAATDPATRKTVSTQINDIENELSREEAAAARPLPPDEAANVALVSPRRKELQTLSGLP